MHLCSVIQHNISAMVLMGIAMVAIVMVCKGIAVMVMPGVCIAVMVMRGGAQHLKLQTLASV